MFTGSSRPPRKCYHAKEHETPKASPKREANPQANTDGNMAWIRKIIWFIHLGRKRAQLSGDVICPQDRAKPFRLQNPSPASRGTKRETIHNGVKEES